MKKYISIVLAVLLICTLVRPVQAESGSVPKVIVLSATDEVKDGYPVLEKRAGSRKLDELVNHSFIKKSLEIYKNALKYSGTMDDVFYLSFKPQSGEYGRIGFYLKSNGQLLDMTSTPYIEINEEELTLDQGRLQSMTQIFPHEMGHILLGLTSAKFRNPGSNNLDMHYSNVMTQYSTAFNEGFAEHFEIIARKYEENKEIKNGIILDIAIKEKRIKPVLSRVERDFVFPLRFDFYRGTAIFWFGQAEGLKRESLPVSGDCIYKTAYRKYGNIEKTLLFRNMGLKQAYQNKRSIQQSLSVESVVSRFFVLLEESNKLPLVDYYSKLLKVFNKYVGSEEGSPLIEFVNGYCVEYPAEKEILHNCFKAATGYQFTNDIAPEIWLVSEGRHIITPMDQFGAMKFPLYIFNINACEAEDLLKLGIKASEAEKIIQNRDHKGYFLNIGELEKVEGVRSETLNIITEASFNGWTQERFDKLLNAAVGNLNFSMVPMIASYFTHLLIRSIILFAIFFAVYSQVILKRRKVYIKSAVKQLLKFLLYVLTGLISAAASSVINIQNTSIHPVGMFVIIILAMEAVKLLILRKNAVKFKDSLVSTLMMAAVIVYSLI